MENILYVGTERGMFTLRGGNDGPWEIAETALGTWAVPELAVSPDGPERICRA